MKKNFKDDLLLDLDAVFDSDSNDYNFSSPALPGGEKKPFFARNDLTSRRRRIFHFLNESSWVALESWNDDHSTQNRKIHLTVVSDMLRKNHSRQFVFILPV